MKLAAHNYLDDMGIPYQALAFPEATAKGAANVARILGFRERQMVKTLVFRAKDECVLIMVGGGVEV